MAYPNKDRYTPNHGTAGSSNWQEGDYVTATNMNHIEDGIDQALQDAENYTDTAVEDIKDGNIVAGKSDNLTLYGDESGVFQSEPFSLQATGTANGTQIDFATDSHAFLKEKHGNTISMNQLVRNSNFASDSGWSVTAGASFTTVHNTGRITITASSTTVSLSRSDVAFINHTYGFGTPYLVSCWVKVPITTDCAIGGFATATTGGNTKTIEANTWTQLVFLGGRASNNNTTISLTIYASTMSIGSVIEVKDFIVIDLLRWFGSYNKMPAELLSDPERFFKYYRGPLIWNEGTLMNSDGRYLKCVGRNQYNGAHGSYEVDFIPNTVYYIKGAATLTYLDTNDVTIFSEIKSNTTFKTPVNCVKVAVDGNEDTCISLFYENESGYDQYYEYETLSYVDTGEEVLRSTGKIKDIKNPDGTITRYVGTYLLTGKEAFTISGSSVRRTASILASDLNLGNLTTANEAMCNNFHYGNLDVMTGVDGGLGAFDLGTSLRFNIYNIGVTTAAQFKSWLQSHPTTIYYPLATPITESGTSFNENLTINDFGSMSFEGVNGIPQGNLIYYPADYKAYLDTLFNYTKGSPNALAKGGFKGSVNFSVLLDLADSHEGDIYNIIDDFDSDSRFLEYNEQRTNSLKTYPAGTDVMCVVKDGRKYWNVLGSPLPYTSGTGARAYKTDQQYHVGDYCIYQGALYKCISETSGSWIASKWIGDGLATTVQVTEAISEAIVNNTLAGIEWSAFNSSADFWDAITWLGLQYDTAMVISCFGICNFTSVGYLTTHNIYLTGFYFENKYPNKLLLFGYDLTDGSIFTAKHFDIGIDTMDGPMGSYCYITKNRIIHYSSNY